MLAAPSLLSLGPPHLSFTLVWGQKVGEAHRDLSRYHSAARPGLLQTEPVEGTCLSFCRTPHSSLWLGRTMRGPTVAFRGGVQLARCGANLAHSGHHLAPPLSRESGSLPEKKGLSPKLLPKGHSLTPQRPTPSRGCPGSWLIRAIHPHLFPLWGGRVRAIFPLGRGTLTPGHHTLEDLLTSSYLSTCVLFWYLGPQAPLHFSVCSQRLE